MKQRLLSTWLLTMFLGLFAANAWAEDKTSTLTFTEACKGSGTADDRVEWTVTSDAAESQFENPKGIHYGTSKNAVSYLTLTSAFFEKQIKKVVVNASGASGTSAKLDVSVGGTAFGTQQSLTSTATSYTFSGAASGVVVVTLSQTSAKKALYVKSIAVTYEDSDGSSKTLSSIAISGTPTKTTYTEGDTFNPAGLVVTGTYSDESTAEITDGITWSFAPETLALGTTSVDVTAMVDEVTSSAYPVDVTVSEFVQTWANTYTSNVEYSGLESGTVIWNGVEYPAIKAGTGSNAGSCTVTIPANTKTLHFHAVGWKGETVVLTVDGKSTTFNLVADDGVTSDSPYTLQNDPETNDYFTLDPNGATSITLKATNGKRFVLFGVNAEMNKDTDQPICVKWSVNGEIVKTEEVEGGLAATAPEVIVPDGYTQKFMGWVTTETVAADAAPAYVTSFEANADITYYAVFADEVDGGSSDYKRVTAALTDWSGDYLIAYNAGENNTAKDDYFADGRVGGKDNDGSIGKTGVKAIPEATAWVDNNTIKATWGDTYKVSFVSISGGYVMQTQDGLYNYHTNNTSNGLSVNDITTADDHPITVNFISAENVQLIVHDGAIFHYNKGDKMFRFYKNGGQEALYLYKKSGNASYTGFTTLLQRETISIAAKAFDEGKTNKYYGTYYSANNLVVGEDMTCAVVGVNEDKTKIVINAFKTGDIIPAETGFMVYATESGDHYMAVTTATPSELPGNNLLRGSLEAATTTGPDEGNYLFYKLTFYGGKDLGFWWGADDGAAFTNGAHKAYLAVPQAVAMQVRGFAFGDMETAISTLTTAETGAPLYDLQGRRISMPQHGRLYIQGGKKYIK